MLEGFDFLIIEKLFKVLIRYQHINKVILPPTKMN